MSQNTSSRLIDILPPANIELDVPARSKAQVIEHLAARAGAELGVPAAFVARGLLQRESHGSTGVGRGIALPHMHVVPASGEYPCAGIGEPYALLLRLAGAVDFQAVDGDPVDIVFMLLAPRVSGSAGLTILRDAARILRQQDFVDRFRTAQTPAAAYAAMVEAEYFTRAEA